MRIIKKICFASALISLILSALLSCGVGGGECEHTYLAWRTESASTCILQGSLVRECSACGRIERQPIPLGDHSFEEGLCSVCGVHAPDPALCEHKDENSNDVCDLCNISVAVVLNFFAINDLHGKIFDTDKQPGVDELTTYLEKAGGDDGNTIVLSSGDMWQGSSESNLTRGEITTEWMNEIGVVSMTLGNHEYDWANGYIYKNLELADFPFLAINIYDRETDERVPYAEPSVTLEVDGIKIGIIGAIGDCYSSISADKVTDIYFKTGYALTSLVKAESERLRDEGCDYIIYSLHDGATESGKKMISDSRLSSYYDISLSRGYVDLVFEAHTHHDYILTDSEGVYHIQAGAENTAISHAEVKFNYVNDTSRVSYIDTVSSYVYGGEQSDEIVSELYEKYAEEIAKGNELLGVTDEYLGSYTLKQLVADLYALEGEQRWGEKYDLVLGGGFISARSPYDIPAGDVYYKDVYEIFPFDNELCLCSISGRDLLNKFINSSNSNYYIAVTEYGSSLKIEEDATYYLVTDSYSSYYAPNRLTIIEKLDEELYARDLISEYIKETWGN